MAKGKGGKKGKKEKKEKKEKVVHGHEYYEKRVTAAEADVDEFQDKMENRLLSLEEITALLEQLESDKHDVTSYINRMIHEKETNIEEINERRDVLIDTAVTDGLKNQLKQEAKVLFLK